MNKIVPVLFIFLFFSCKSLRYDDQMIAFDHLNLQDKEVNIHGDFDEIDFFNDDKIYISCGYFRDWEINARSLRVIIVLEKKYAFQTYGSVTSSEFGTIPLSTENLPKRNGDLDEFHFVKSLAEMDLVERKNRILNDTIEIKFGGLNFSYVPRSVLRK